MLKPLFEIIAPVCAFEPTIIGEIIFTSLLLVVPNKGRLKSGEIKEIISVAIR